MLKVFNFLFYILKGDSWLICTGGDDNALSAIIVKVDSSLASWEIVGKTQIYSAHSSQITGIFSLVFILNEIEFCF